MTNKENFHKRCETFYGTPDPDGNDPYTIHMIIARSVVKTDDPNITECSFGFDSVKLTDDDFKYDFDESMVHIEYQSLQRLKNFQLDPNDDIYDKIDPNQVHDYRLRKAAINMARSTRRGIDTSNPFPGVYLYNGSFWWDKAVYLSQHPKTKKYAVVFHTKFSDYGFLIQ